MHLDTHVVAWLYAGRVDALSDLAKHHIEESELVVSPVVLLELDGLRRRQVIRVSAQAIYSDLKQRIGLTLEDIALERLVECAIPLPPSKNLFDRLLVAQAALALAPLLSKDAAIHALYPGAIW